MTSDTTLQQAATIATAAATLGVDCLGLALASAFGSDSSLAGSGDFTWEYKLPPWMQPDGI